MRGKPQQGKSITGIDGRGLESESRIVVDYAMLDVVACPQNRRPTLVMAMDRESARIVGWWISFDPGHDKKVLDGLKDLSDRQRRHFD